MAKRRPANTGSSTFKKVLASIPASVEFDIDMVADSTTEVWTDIDTGIGDREAWVIYGMEYTVENVDPTVPLVGIEGVATANTWQLQIQRNDDSEVLLRYGDDDLLLNHTVRVGVHTSGGITLQSPFQYMKRTITMQPTLRALFRTSIDCTAISLTTCILRGRLFYDPIQAPDVGVSKIGLIANL